MAKSFYRLPEKEIKAAVINLLEKNEIRGFENGYILKDDLQEIEKFEAPPAFIYALHRNDFLVRSNEHIIKDRFKQAEREILQYLLIDGEIRGAVTGHFKYGPYILEDIVLDSPEYFQGREEEIFEAVYAVNGRENPVKRYCGKEI